MVTLENSIGSNANTEDVADSGTTSANGTETSSSITKSGMRCNIKNLYQGKEDRVGRFTWVEKYPEDWEEAAENAETARYALLIRNKKSFDSRKKSEIDSIVVQSPLLKAVLETVLEAYPGITTGLDRLTFSAPFQPFVHRWERLVEAKEATDDAETKEHVELLFNTLETELGDTIKAKNDLVSHGVCTFEHMWTIFEPGDFVFTTQDSAECALQLQSADYQTLRCGKVYTLNSDKVDWDGENFGRNRTSLNICKFNGTLPITQLAVYPLKYHSGEAKLRERLIERGRLFEELRGYNFREYRGIAIGPGMFGPIKYTVDSRIIIDTYAYNRFNPNRSVALSSLGQADQGSDSYSMDGSMSDDEQRGGAQESRATLTKDELLIASPSVKGYALKTKKWLSFSIDSVRDIEWSDSAFQSLVLPAKQKELVLAFAESQVKYKGAFDDVIQGKGKGIIILLSGAPGVGKTLTAESVAETMRVPLYMMSAGDLGIEPGDVESALSNIMEMSAKWNAVLLLDEADVFLEQRSTHDLERNKLVSIFLRILEYYEGILFLTTNRVENIDAAFQSRIHISMAYDELTASSRRHVWSNFLTISTQDNDFSDADLDRLAEYPLNGRQIKNVLKTAQLLASRKGAPLRFEHVDTVMSIEKKRVV